MVATNTKFLNDFLKKELDRLKVKVDSDQTSLMWVDDSNYIFFDYVHQSNTIFVNKVFSERTCSMFASDMSSFENSLRDVFTRKYGSCSIKIKPCSNLINEPLEEGVDYVKELSLVALEKMINLYSKTKCVEVTDSEKQKKIKLLQQKKTNFVFEIKKTIRKILK